MAAGTIFRRMRLPLLLACAASALQAQNAYPAATPYARPTLASANDPSELLARYLRTLATSPSDLEALSGAGHAALAIGDANAALAFYARAEAIAPRDGRIKAGIASALLQLEKPREAIRMFDDAADLGVPDADIAGDRGLAWDLRGDWRRAQKDYALALRSRPDDETTRRLALSLAISGDRDGGLALLDPLLRRGDAAGWRARAFILAMGGDVGGAEVVARSAMSAAQVGALRPFLVRLASLKPAQKAMAVHFGVMPADGRSYSETELAALAGPAPIPSPRPAQAIGLVPFGEPFGRRTPTADPAPLPPKLASAPRRRPGASDAPAREIAAAPAPPTPAQVAMLNVAKIPGEGAATSTKVGQASIPPPDPPPQSKPAAVAEKPAAQVALAARQEVPAIATAASAPVGAPPQDVKTVVTTPVATGSALAPYSTSVEAKVASSSPVASPPPSQAIAAANDTPSASAPQPITLALTAKPRPMPFALDPAIAEQARAEEAVRVAASSPPPAATAPSTTPDQTVGAPAPIRIADVAPMSPFPGAVRAADIPAKKEPIPPPAEAKVAHPEPKADVRPLDRNAKAEVKEKTDAKAEEKSKSDAKGKPDAKAKTKDDEKDKKSAPSKSAAASPERVWVQVAGGATKADLPKAYAKLKPKLPALAKSQSAWTTPLRFTNRLLVGPFKSAAGAQEYVNAMGKAGLSGFVFTSPEGQEIEKLAGK